MRSDVCFFIALASFWIYLKFLLPSAFNAIGLNRKMKIARKKLDDMSNQEIDLTVKKISKEFLFSLIKILIVSASYVFLFEIMNRLPCRHISLPIVGSVYWAFPFFTLLIIVNLVYKKVVGK